MSSLGALIERLPTTWKAVLALAAIFTAGFAARGIVDSQVGLPARVYALEVSFRDSLVLPRIRSVEQYVSQNRALIQQGADADADILIKLDSIARNTCLALAEIRKESFVPCNRVVR